MPHASGVVLVGPVSSGKSDLARCLRARGVDVIDPANLQEERAALATARAVAFVIGATDGIDSPTTYLWREVAAAHLPCTVIVTKVDDPRADFDETCALVWRLFDPHGCVPVTLPVLDDDDHLAGFLDLTSGTIREYRGDSSRLVATESQHRELTSQASQRLHDTLLAMGENTLADATAAGLVTPILGFASPGCVGSEEVVTVLEWLSRAETPVPGTFHWPVPLSAPSPTAELTITIPDDYVDDVETYLRRYVNAEIIRVSPGDGTCVFTMTGAIALLERVPIDVHGLTDGSSACHVSP